MRQIRNAIGATTINPKLLTAAERLQYEGYLRREETNTGILTDRPPDWAQQEAGAAGNPRRA
jgi:hypothetical protein